MMFAGVGRACASRSCVYAACAQRARVQRVQLVSSVLVIASVCMMGVGKCRDGGVQVEHSEVVLCEGRAGRESRRVMVRICAVCCSGASRGRIRTFLGRASC